MDYEKAYKQALERAKKIREEILNNEIIGFPGQITDIFPELRESEDERIRKAIMSRFQERIRLSEEEFPVYTQEEVAEDRLFLAWLEKQKYDRMKPIYDARESFESALEKAWNDYHNGYENVDKLEDDYVECAHAKGFREGYLFGIEKQKEEEGYEAIPVESTLEYKLGFKAGKEFEKQKEPKDPFDDEQFSRGYEAGKHDALRGQVDAFVTEYNKGFEAGRLEGITAGYNKAVKEMEQKENPDSFTDEHPNIIYTEMGEEFAKQKEQKPVETSDFKTKLSEYLQNNSPKDGKYVISSESILQMAKEELIRRGELKEQKPVAWSEEDKKILDDVSHILIGLNYKQIAKDYKQAVEKLIYARPSWKPSEEQMEAMEFVIKDYREDGCIATANYLQEILDQIKKL